MPRPTPNTFPFAWYKDIPIFNKPWMEHLDSLLLIRYWRKKGGETRLWLWVRELDIAMWMIKTPYGEFTVASSGIMGAMQAVPDSDPRRPSYKDNT